MHTGIALVTGSEDRQWLYPAMTRGTDANLAYVFTAPARPADPQPGARPAPELDRYERIRRERAGYLPDEPRLPAGPGGPARADRRARRHPQPRRRRTIGVRDPAAQPGQRRPPRHPARDLDRRNPSRPPRPYRDLVTAALPPGHRQPLSHQARWLFRTLHAAELAGLDPAEVIHTAIATGTWPEPVISLPSWMPDPPAHRPAAPVAAGRLSRTGTPAADPDRRAYLSGSPH